MNKQHKTADVRNKELRLAISRIERGRARTKETKLTIASVAREAGVSTSLIHNHYPDIAEIIRDAQGACSRAQRDAKQNELKAERDKSRLLRQESETLRAQVAKLASINEVLQSENRVLKAKQSGTTVVDFPSKK